jgi:hypothetical protein
MKKSQPTESNILVLRPNGQGSSLHHNDPRRAKCDPLVPADILRLLELENTQLQKIATDLWLENEVLRRNMPHTKDVTS